MNKMFNLLHIVHIYGVYVISGYHLCLDWRKNKVQLVETSSNLLYPATERIFFYPDGQKCLSRFLKYLQTGLVFWVFPHQSIYFWDQMFTGTVLAEFLTS